MAPGLLGIIRDLAANKGIHLKKKKNSQITGVRLFWSLYKEVSSFFILFRNPCRSSRRNGAKGGRL